jgi:hypothetical protein
MAGASAETTIVSRVPPPVGPDHGLRLLRITGTAAKRTALVVYSRPFVVTPTSTLPALAKAPVLHTALAVLR